MEAGLAHIYIVVGVSPRAQHEVAEPHGAVEQHLAQAVTFAGIHGSPDGRGGGAPARAPDRPGLAPGAARVPSVACPYRTQTLTKSVPTAAGGRQAGAVRSARFGVAAIRSRLDGRPAWEQTNWI